MGRKYTFVIQMVTAAAWGSTSGAQQAGGRLWSQKASGADKLCGFGPSEVFLLRNGGENPRCAVKLGTQAHQFLKDRGTDLSGYMGASSS